MKMIKAVEPGTEKWEALVESLRILELRPPQVASDEIKTQDGMKYAVKTMYSMYRQGDLPPQIGAADTGLTCTQVSLHAGFVCALIPCVVHLRMLVRRL